jgi:hypothetical protein
MFAGSGLAWPKALYLQGSPLCRAPSPLTRSCCSVPRAIVRHDLAGSSLHVRPLGSKGDNGLAQRRHWPRLAKAVRLKVRGSVGSDVSAAREDSRKKVSDGVQGNPL